MKIVAHYVRPDEPCHGLFEGPRQIPKVGERWIQAVYVVRDDAIAEWTQDLGPAEDFARAQPLIMPSPDGCNTVGELQDLADKNRIDDYWAKRADEMLAESTLIEDVVRGIEQKARIIANRSTFGPAGNHQRNGFPRNAAQEAQHG